MNKNITLVKNIIKNEYFILSIILFIGFVVRLYKINNPVADWHSWRQADTASVTRNFVNEGINLLYPKYDDISSIQSGIENPKGLRMVEFPVYNTIVAVFYEIFGYFNLEVWGRLITSVITVISALFLFLLGKRHGSSKTGLFASAFFLFLPFNIYFSRVILPDPLGVLFALASLYFFDTKIVLSGILFGLAMLQKPYFVFFLFPLIPDFLDRKKIKRNFIFAFFALFPFILWRFWISMFPEGIPFYKWAFNGNKIRFHPSFFRWIFGERLGYLILGIWGLIPFSFGILSKDKDKFFKNFAVGMLLYLIVVASANVMHDYYQILIIPVVSLLLARGSELLIKKSKTFFIFCIFMSFLIGVNKVLPFYQINHPEIVEVGKEINKLLPKEALIVAPYNGDTAFLYQTERKGWPAVDDSIDNIIERGADYYVSLDLMSLDTLNFEKRFSTLIKTDKYIVLDLRQ